MPNRQRPPRGGDFAPTSGRDPSEALPGLEVVLQTKLAPARIRPGLVERASLLERLSRPDPAPAVGVFAPAGYGKSTLLGQWAARDPRPFAWLTLDERDNDPAVLLGYVALAVHRLAPLASEVFAAIASPGPSPWTAAVPRLGSAIAAMRDPIVFVVDDLEHLTEPACADILVALAEHLPNGSRIAYAGRSAGHLPLGRLVASGRLVILGPAELALDDAEAAAILAGAGLNLGPGQVRALNRRAEGWPVGVYLAALSSRAPASPASALAAGRDQLLARYVREELLDGLPAERRRFLLRCAVLERLCGSLCDEVLGREGSAVELRALAELNLFLAPLDEDGEWYRFHSLFRDLLLRELAVAEPGVEARLRGRAADWYEAHGMSDEVIEYALAAGDVERVLRLLPTVGQAAYNRGHADTLRRWFGWLEERGLEDHDAPTAVLGQLLFSFLGDAPRSDRWADAAERALRATRRTDSTAAAMVALARALRAPDGVEAMLADAGRSVELIASASPWRVAALTALGIALELAGRDDEAALRLEEALAAYAAVSPSRRVAHTAAALAAAHRGSLAMAAGAWRGAREQVALARNIVRAAHLEEHAAGVVVDAVAARLAIQRGAAAQARVDLARAQRNRPLLTYALPWQAVRTRLDLARVCLALGGSPGARTLLAEVRGLLEQQPDLGTLVQEADALRDQVNQGGGVRSGPYSLTLAELRLLPLLGTHLTFREIGQRLYLSPNTVKSQALSIYRKLDASSRSEAVSRAAEAGLTESLRPSQMIGSA